MKSYLFVLFTFSSILLFQNCSESGLEAISSDSVSLDKFTDSNLDDSIANDGGDDSGAGGNSGGNAGNGNNGGGAGGGNSGSGSSQVQADHTIDVLDTVWFPMRTNINAPDNTSGIVTALKDDVVALKVDFSDPDLVWNFGPTNGAFMFHAIYKWHSPSEREDRHAHQNTVIQPLLAIRNSILINLNREQRDLAPAAATCGSVPLSQCFNYIRERREYDALLAEYNQAQRNITRANLAYGYRRYEPNRISVEIVDENNNPPQFNCFGPSYNGDSMTGVSFSFRQRAVQAPILDCQDVRANKKWFILIQVNHCNYKQYTTDENGNTRQVGEIQQDRNCNLQIEAWRDILYYN